MVVTMSSRLIQVERLSLAVAVAISGVANIWAANSPVATAATSASNPSTVNASTFNQLLSRIGITAEFGKQVPLSTTFIDSTGQPIQLGKCLRGRPTIIHLVYYQCPMLCKLTTDGLLSTLSTISLKMGQDFSVVTVSFDPRDGPENSARAKLLAGERCGQDRVDQGWKFLTGDESSISTVTNAVGFHYTFDETTHQFAHPAGIFVLTPEGKVSRYLSGTDYSPRDLRMALIEASNGKIGNAIDHALMLCYMYDPTVGKYGLAVVSIMRIAGLATVGGLAVAIITMIRRDRRRQSSLSGNVTATSEYNSSNGQQTSA
jgi:protein SCO1/2